MCSLLTAAQASSINQVTYGAGTPQQIAANYDDCTYPNKGSADPVDIQALSVDVLSYTGSWAGPQSADGPGTPVSGVGDAAFGDSIGLDVHAGSRCIVIKGLTHAELNGDYSHDVALAEDRARRAALTERALSRWPMALRIAGPASVSGAEDGTSVAQ